MGFRYQDLKNRGDSIELERKESFTTERSHNGYIKRRKTILRERFAYPNSKEVRKNHRQQPQHSAAPTTHRPATESGRSTTETFGNSAGSATLVSTCRERTHLERAVNRTSAQLKRLAYEIDNEISKLKRERDKLMFRPRPHPLMRNAAIQNDFHVDEALSKPNLDQFNTIADNIEFTIEKFSSQHKFVCTSPRYARDEQTSCRPRMRTIGLQKDTRRSVVDCEDFQNIKAKLDTVLNYSATNLANLKSKRLLDPAPPNCYAFDYGGTGDGQNELKLYHLQNCRCAGGCNQNECNCQKVCEHYNSVGNYNGMMCNKKTYVEKGVTPCNEYKYCRDEYRYDYPKQNNCVVPIPNAPCTPCVPYQPYQPCVAYLPPCPIYSESKPTKPKTEVIYGRRQSDLNTDEFYHPTSASPRKRSPTKQGSAKHSSNKERLTVDVPKDGRTFVNIERHGHAHSKSRRKKDDGEIGKQRSSYQESSPDKTKRHERQHKSQRNNESSGSADSSEKARQTKSKEKLLQITFTKERRRKNSSESGEEHVPYEVQPIREYSRETKRSMKQMTITAYKPFKAEGSEGNSDVERKKKKRKSRDRGDNDKSDDDKTWDERLRQGEERPHAEDDYAGIPTITEVYDNYRVGDVWIDEEDNVAKQHTGTAHVGGYRELYPVPPSRSYDIMPVQKNTVRDIPPSQSPERGQRSKHFERPGRYDNEDMRRSEVDPRGRPHRSDIQPRFDRGGVNGMKPNSLISRESDSKDRSGSGIGRVGQPRTEKDLTRGKKPRSFSSPVGQPRTGRGYNNGMEPGSFSAYGLTEKPRFDAKPALRSGFEMDSSYAPDDRSKPNATSTPDEKPSRARNYTPDRRYDTGSTPRRVNDYDHGQARADNMYDPNRPRERDHESFHIDSPATMHTPDGKPWLTHEERAQDADSPSYKSYKPHTPRGDVPDKIESAAINGHSPDSTSRYQPKPDNDSPRHATQDPSVASTPGTIYTPGGNLNSASEYGTDGHLGTGKLKNVDSLQMGTLTLTSSLKSASKASPGKIELSDSIHGGKRGKRETSGPDNIDDADSQKTKLKAEGEERNKPEYEQKMRENEIATGSYGLSKKKKTERIPSPNTGTSKTVNGSGARAHTGKEAESPRVLPDSGHIFQTALEVPEIKIEDLDDSGKSARSGMDQSPRVTLPGRTKFAIKGEMVLESQQAGTAQYKISSEPERTPTTDGTTDKGEGRPMTMRLDDTFKIRERIGKTDALDEPYGTGRVGRATSSDRSQILSPFPSLESPTIYMRPRETDYGSACLPSTNDCPKRTSPRVNCVENAGDVYMCKPRPCSAQNVSPPTSPCRCLSPHRSGSEIPYEKLGDQYTHSPVRQLAANSHLAVALQPEAATGNYIPSPQQQPSKNCIYLRSTGTQYSATIIERLEDRCAPQYVPLPKHCSESLVDKAKNSPLHSPSASASPRKDSQSVCDSESPQDNYQFLCDEENQEYKGKINFNNEQWCERVEVTNLEKTQITIAQEQRQQQQNQNSRNTDHKNFCLPWQQDKKFIPGQPMGDCNMPPWQDESQSSLKPMSRYQSNTDRRTLRFNTNLAPHQEMPEEEARCAQEMLQYRPQSRAQFMEQKCQKCEVRDRCCCAREEEISFRNEAGEPKEECTPRGRSEFEDCRDYQEIPEFTGCPCMFKTYLNMVTLYYPECRIQMQNGGSMMEDAEFIDS